MLLLLFGFLFICMSVTWSSDNNPPFLWLHLCNRIKASSGAIRGKLIDLYQNDEVPRAVNVAVWGLGEVRTYQGCKHGMALSGNSGAGCKISGCPLSKQLCNWPVVKIHVMDGTMCSTATFFSPYAEKLLGLTLAELVAKIAVNISWLIGQI